MSTSIFHPINPDLFWTGDYDDFRSCKQNLTNLLDECRKAIEAQLKFNRETADPLCRAVLRKIKRIQNDSP